VRPPRDEHADEHHPRVRAGRAREFQLSGRIAASTAQAPSFEIMSTRMTSTAAVEASCMPTACPLRTFARSSGLGESSDCASRAASAPIFPYAGDREALTAPALQVS
jgi:hypothetical protein